MTKEPASFSRIDWILLGLILLVALVLRLYNVTSPLADWHSWRQADTAAVSRNLVEKDFNLMRPIYDDLSNVQTGEYNPEGLRFVEFPLYNAATALVYKAIPMVPIEQIARYITIFCSLIVIASLYYLVRLEVSRLSAICAGLIYAVFPFFVYYSRVVLPETPGLACMSISIVLLYMYMKSKPGSLKLLQFILACVGAAAALLIKPTLIFYLIVAGCMYWAKYRLSIFKRIDAYLYVALAILPMIAWRMYIQQFPVGIPAYDWLITTVNTYEGPKVIFMRPAFFRWIFHERILNLIMGGWAAVFIVIGALKRSTRSMTIPYGIGLSALTYLLTFQGGNVQHDYYQTLILPALAVFAGIGIAMIYENKKTFTHPFLVSIIVVGLLGFSWLMSYETVKGYYGYSEQLIQTAKIIDTITPKDALVITESVGDTTLLYNARRRGMPSTADTLPKLKERGMQYFVTTSDETIAKTQKENPEYEIIFKNDGVSIFKL
ncbi:glycosyltransferase family 39 protein [Candidatus Woesebacteria bacterium]|nr:glycosyltransferase family 39 protein [Candidatus Woesebacteria bacterium]